MCGEEKCASWPPYLLSPSSQGKEQRQGFIEGTERVSAECSSGVVRVLHSIPGVWSLCAEDS